ncbi:MAG: 23S rRNA (uracil-5-)-methyltransferase RumA [Candidatus Parcubacteria bacterium]|nr:MAG: 23S rRNA (uracil-5-)-methyltransferase RumA [Candidatus Parcubacteria bacterium]
MREIIVDFYKIGENGISIGKFKDKIVFSYGILPEERAKIKINKEKKNFIEGELVEVLFSSPYRIQPKENHYLSCSPWQSFAYSFQIKLKKDILKQIFLKFANYNIELDNFYSAQEIFGYRTKIEYTFLEENSHYFYAFYKRGNSKEKIKLKNGCCLISEEVNKISLEILNLINERKIKNLKSLIVRKSRNEKYIHFSLLTMDKNQRFLYYDEKITGFIFVFSNPQSPASTFDEILTMWGKEYLEEKILNLYIRYPYNSFFQNNIELFEKALQLMFDNSDNFKKIVDLYSGVGVIGLALKEKAKKILAVDVNKESIFYAISNAKLNNIENFKALNLASEKIPQSILNNTDLLILDPPRSGIHKNLINLILKTRPKNIFYLSCNPITQARDFNFLKEKYKIKRIYALDFYPNTPHIESLIILSLK